MNGIRRRKQNTAFASSFGQGFACALLAGKGLSAAYFNNTFFGIYLLKAERQRRLGFADKYFI
jgi:hypothetical protein